MTLGAIGKEHTKHHGINDAAHKPQVGYPSKHWCGSQDLAEPPSAEGITVAFVPVQAAFDMFVTRDLLCLLVNLPPMVHAFLGASGDLRKQIFEKMLRMKRQRSFTPGNALALTRIVACDAMCEKNGDQANTNSKKSETAHTKHQHKTKKSRNVHLSRIQPKS